MVAKRTVLGRLRLMMDFSEELQLALRSYPDQWFAHGEGAQFFGEFRSTWRNILIESAEPEIRSYFAHTGIPEEFLPRLEIEEEYAGSWIVDAAIVMMGTAGTVYTVLKGASELPEIADGLANLKGRVLGRFKPHAEAEVEERLRQVTRGNAPPTRNDASLPNAGALLDVDLVIDARPLASLKPAQLKYHSIHLAVGVSRETLTIENLGDQPISNLRVGLFHSLTARGEWKFAEAYAGSVDLLSSKQTLSKSLDGFCNSAGESFQVDAQSPVFVDCWVQDNSGIYLFNFYLDQE